MSRSEEISQLHYTGYNDKNMCGTPFILLPTDDSDEAINTISLPSSLKLTPGEVCCFGNLSETLYCEGQLPSHSAAPSIGGSRLQLVQNSTSAFALPPLSTLGVKQESACHPKRPSSFGLEGRTCVCVGNIFCSRPSMAT